MSLLTGHANSWSSMSGGVDRAMDTGQDAMGKHTIYCADVARTEITQVGRDERRERGRAGLQVGELKYLVR